MSFIPEKSLKAPAESAADFKTCTKETFMALLWGSRRETNAFPRYDSMMLGLV